MLVPTLLILSSMRVGGGIGRLKGAVEGGGAIVGCAFDDFFSTFRRGYRGIGVCVYTDYSYENTLYKLTKLQLYKVREGEVMKGCFVQSTQ